MRTALPLLLAVSLLAGGCSRSDAEVDRLLAALRQGDKEGRALADLGPAHADGIPAVLQALTSDDRRFVQITCLEALLGMRAGEEARAAIEELFDERDAIVVDRAALVHWKLFGEANPGLDRLLLRAPSELNARLLLERAPPLPADLAAAIAEKGELAVLAALGPAMSAALPRIEKALGATSADERILAARAHFRVSGQLQPALGVLAREFSADNLFLRQRIHAIWLVMLRDQPAAMRGELKKLAKSEHESVRTMANQMLNE